MKFKPEKLMKKLFTIFVLFLFSFDSLALSDQYYARTEFSTCKLADGKTYEDVVAYHKQYEAFLKDNNLKYAKYILTPVIAGDVDYDYITWGTWPGGVEMYEEYGAYLNDYTPPPGNPGICSGTFSVHFNAAIRIRPPVSEYDKRMFVEFRNCKFKGESTVDDLLKIDAEREAIMRDADAMGYGRSYLRPYRGFSEDEYDFAVMTHWYNRDYRADSVKSYRKMTTLFREKGIFDGYREHVEGCERTPRVYASEWLYSTISD